MFQRFQRPRHVLSWCMGSLLLASSALAQGTEAAPPPAAAPAPTPSAAPVPVPGPVTPEAPEPATDTPPAPPSVALPASGTATSANDTQVAEPAAVEVDRQLFETMLAEQANAQAEVPKLELFGFSDFIYRQYIFKDSTTWGSVLPESVSPQLMVGNLNLYVRGNLAPQWTSLAEVRFHFSPVGDKLPPKQAISDPTTPDFIDPEGKDQVEFGRSFDRGSIEIERAYIEYNPYPWLGVRAGRFLTPYGIWNVDHGSPVLIDVTRPYIIGDALLPEAQTGLNAFGEFGAGKIDAGYHVTVSNGRGPIEQVGDLDKNKGLGGRLWLRFRSVGELTVGASGYYGTYTDRRLELIDAATQKVDWTVWERYRELGLATDLRYTLGGLLIVSETVSQQSVWDDDARPIAPPAQASTDSTGLADRVRWGTYGLVGYRFDWLGLMPFMLYQWYNAGYRDALAGGSTLSALSGGLNARVVPAVVLKLVLTYTHFPSATPGSPASDDLWLLTSQIAWAF